MPSWQRMRPSNIRSVDYAILAKLESGLPLTPRPFRDLGNSLDITTDLSDLKQAEDLGGRNENLKQAEDLGGRNENLKRVKDLDSRNENLKEAETISHIYSLKERGIIRQIGPLFEPRQLNYKTALVGVKAKPIETGANLIATYPGVSHVYEREHEINLWFTIAVPADVNIEEKVTELLGPTAIETPIILPALRVFKLQSAFTTQGGTKQVKPPSINPLPLSDIEKAVINSLPADLPLIPQPFDDIAGQIGIQVDTLLATCRQLMERGVMRRFSASINHRSLGFAANAMACWDVPKEFVGDMAQHLVAFPEVSHCYERKVTPAWPFNLFAMVHAPERQLCLDIIERVSDLTGQKNRVVLFSNREFVKRRARYTV